MFSLAHLSDLHLGPLPSGAMRRNFALKRSIGALNWRLSRHKMHEPALALAIAEDIRAAAPDHVALTGDIVNVSAHQEFVAAAAWLAAFGPPDWISFVPGNHDAYVRCDWQHGLGHLAAYMAGDMRLAGTTSSVQIATPFPYVRLRRNVALIGLSTAIPQPVGFASGLLGEAQLATLPRLLEDLRTRGYARVVMIHHPPLPGLTRPRRELRDATALRDILANHGAELVLHGHNHEPSHIELDSRTGPVNIFGVPSASMARTTHHAPAAWNLYGIQRTSGRWQIAVTTRRFDPATRAIATVGSLDLRMG